MRIIMKTGYGLAFDHFPQPHWLKTWSNTIPWATASTLKPKGWLKSLVQDYTEAMGWLLPQTKATSPLPHRRTTRLEG
ncbi:hypothetical protein KBZ19_09185 [Synechococcus sp. L2F]|nr:hypothetical protein [Synechococcus sp. L2F]